MTAVARRPFADVKGGLVETIVVEVIKSGRCDTVHVASER